jgi:hypothetical protein
MNQLTVTLLFATSALIAGVAGPIVSISVARRQIRATVISNNRERWIEALRDPLAEYIATVISAKQLETESQNAVDAMVRDDQAFRKTAERMLLVRSKILLMTNPNEDCDRLLWQSIDAVHSAVVTKQTLTLQQWRTRLDAVTAAGHAVLRAEWARVKRGDRDPCAICEVLRATLLFHEG